MLLNKYVFNIIKYQLCKNSVSLYLDVIDFAPRAILKIHWRRGSYIISFFNFLVLCFAVCFLFSRLHKVRIG